MTQDEIIEIWVNLVHKNTAGGACNFQQAAIDLAKLVEERTQVKLFCDGVGGAVAAEREACAKICSDLADKALVSGDEDALICFEQAEDAIRARGQA